MGDKQPPLVTATGGSLLPFSFQFFPRLAAVFAEEVGEFAVGPIKRCFAIFLHRIHIRTIGDQQFGNFLALPVGRLMQGCPS